MKKTCLVVPCYNEEKRLDLTEILNFFSDKDIDVCFVNDGSLDNTLTLITEFSKENNFSSVLNMNKNSGKAEAVRYGVNHCIEKKYKYVGYWDADMATPLSEIPSFLNSLESGKIAVLGSRILRLGSDIDRKWYRHYLGRLFATTASTLLNLPVYDTQCGAKFFEIEKCKEAFQNPFLSQWLFDVEVLFRLKKIGLSLTDYYEVPLSRWRDEHGSKLKITDFLIAPFQLLKMYFKYK